MPGLQTVIIAPSTAEFALGEVRSSRGVSPRGVGPTEAVMASWGPAFARRDLPATRRTRWPRQLAGEDSGVAQGHGPSLAAAARNRLTADRRRAGRPLRVLIVEDSDLYALGLRLLLEEDGSIEVVGRAYNGRIGVEMASELSPDVILMDLNMPVMNGM